MIFIYNIRIYANTIIILICLTGDLMVNKYSNQYSKAIIDNATHACIGLFTGLLVLYEQRHNFASSQEFFTLLGTCVLVSSLIDLDHFIESKTLVLEVISTQKIVLISFKTKRTFLGSNQATPPSIPA